MRKWGICIGLQQIMHTTQASLGLAVWMFSIKNSAISNVVEIFFFFFFFEEMRLNNI